MSSGPYTNQGPPGPSNYNYGQNPLPNNNQQNAFYNAGGGSVQPPITGNGLQSIPAQPKSMVGPQPGGPGFYQPGFQPRMNGPSSNQGPPPPQQSPQQSPPVSHQQHPPSQSSPYGYQPQTSRGPPQQNNQMFQQRPHYQPASQTRPLAGANQLNTQMGGMSIGGNPPSQPGMMGGQGMQNSIRPQGPPPSSMGYSPGPPTSNTVGPPPSTQAQGNIQRMGMANSRPGPPPMGAPPSTSNAQMGMYGNQQTSVAKMSNTVGPPPNNMMGASPNTMMGAPPNSMMGAPPNSMMGTPPNSMMGAPPNSMMGAPPNSMMGVPPNSMMGAPPNSMSAPPNSMMSAPPNSMMGAPPNSMMGAPPNSMMGGPPVGQGFHSGPPSGPPTGPTPPMSPAAGARPGYPGVQQTGMGPQMGPGPGMAPGPGMGQQPAPQRRLDPDQMPSPIQVIEDDKKNRGNEQFMTNSRGQAPPLVTTPFQVIDQGNASPRMLRSTMYNLPCTQDMIKQSQLPMALVASPFAELPENEYTPPLVDHGPNGPIRCNRCKAYMCPFMQFVDGGRRFQCNFCNCVTEVPPEYFQPLDHMGKRVDMYERAELSLGAYEFLATTDYCKNNDFPKAPAFIFMIDVTYQSVKTGMVDLLCKELKTILDHLPREHGNKESSVRVGFVTYNSTLHFYNINSALAQPQMLVVSDVHDVFMPLLDGFLVTVSDSRAVIDSLLDQIPEMFAETRETESMLGPVVQAGLEALKAANCVGKLFIFHTSLPIADAPGKLKNRDDRKLLGTEKEKTLLSPQTGFYTKLGQDCVAAGCSVDLFLFPNAYTDLATIGQVSSITGGQCYKYTYFQASTEGERFMQDLNRNIKRPIAFDAVMRVRTSTGIRATDFHGNFFMSNTVDVELASIDCDKAVTFEIKHDDKLSEETGAFVQVAVLYTSVSGQRRLRLLNLSLNCCTQMADMYRSCETDSIINFLSKHAMKASLNSNPKAIRDGLVNRTAQILACYRKNCASQSSQGQLILPECMKLLPLYCNCIIKSDALQGSSEIMTDDRSWLMQTIMSMDVPSSHIYFYPRLVPLHELKPESNILPVAIRCSADRLSDTGVYLLENGLSMFMWIGLHVPQDWVQDVFGVNSAAQINIESQKLLQIDNRVSTQVRSIVDDVRKTRPRYMKLTLVRQRDALEGWFRHFLVEDKGSNATASYVDFLCHMHKEIRNLLN